VRIVSRLWYGTPFLKIGIWSIEPRIPKPWRHRSLKRGQTALSTQIGSPVITFFLLVP
jgi:hypothetical protein